MLKKIRNIEFLKFLFVIFMIYATTFEASIGAKLAPAIYANMWKESCINAYLGVEYLFIISGFFLFFDALKKEEDTMTYAINKYLCFIPLLLFSILVIWGLSLLGYCKFHMYGNIMSLLFLHDGALTKVVKSVANNGFCWFISVLFWGSIFYHYIARSFNQKAVNLTIAVITFLSYCALLQSNAGFIPGTQTKFFGVIPGSVLRALAGLGLGYLIGVFWNSFPDFLDRIKNKLRMNGTIFFILASAVEIALFTFLVKSSVIHTLEYKNNFILILAFCLLFIFFISNKTFLSRLLDNNLSALLGKYWYSLYITQVIGFILAQHFLWNNKEFVAQNPILNLGLTVAICVVVGFVSCHVVDFLKMKFFPQKKNLQ